MSLCGWIFLGWLVLVACWLCLLGVAKGDPKPPRRRVTHGDDR